MSIVINDKDTNVNIQCSFGFYTFVLRRPDMCDIGVVRVHLRHSTRLVQVQGSAKMPDKTTAAVWFTEQVLSDKFKQLARARSFKITEFNENIWL